MSEERNNDGMGLLLGGLLCFGGGYIFGKKKGREEGWRDGYEEAQDDAYRSLMMASMRHERGIDPEPMGKHARR